MRNTHWFCSLQSPHALLDESARPFGPHHLTQRGLTVLAPVAAAGSALASRPRWLLAAVAACALWAAVITFQVVPGSCTVRSFDLDEVRELRVDRCTFRWRR